VTRWDGWAKAFEEAGKFHAGNLDHNQRLSLELAPAEFAKALKSLDHEHEGLSSGDSRYQAACALGTLTWHDEQGWAVTIVRHGSLASRFHADGREKMADGLPMPEQWAEMARRHGPPAHLDALSSKCCPYHAAGGVAVTACGGELPSGHPLPPAQRGEEPPPEIVPPKGEPPPEPLSADEQHAAAINASSAETGVRAEVVAPGIVRVFSPEPKPKSGLFGKGRKK
jgi:hypothetical protein